MHLIERSAVCAVAEIEYAGLRLRGLKLEFRGGKWEVTVPGRRVRAGWQEVYDIVSPSLLDRLRATLLAEYVRRRAA
jgi:hypothetical protein